MCAQRALQFHASFARCKRTFIRIQKMPRPTNTDVKFRIRRASYPVRLSSMFKSVLCRAAVWQVKKFMNKETNVAILETVRDDDVFILQSG